MILAASLKGAAFFYIFLSYITFDAGSERRYKNHMRNPLFIALFIATLAVLWIGSGLIFGSSGTDNVSEVSQNDENGLVQVRIRESSAQPMRDEITVTGRTRASRKIDISAETAGQVAELLAEKGDIVEEGQVIAKLELRDRGARVAEAEQLVNQRNIQYKASKELAKKGFNSQVRLAEARAQLESARAQLKEARVDLAKIEIKAPFDGVINEQYIEIGDYLSVGDQVFSFVDLDPIEVEGFLTENQVVQARLGGEAVANLLMDRSIKGEITYIAPAANVDTRTFPVEIQAANPDHEIREGLTAEIRIPLSERLAHKISPSILSLADDGTVGIKTLDENDIVQFTKVRLIKDTTEHLWVDGLPEKVRLITVGQEFVLPGQPVEPIQAKEDGLL